MAWKEPPNLPIILTAWYLNHGTGSHSAGDKCTWTPTTECDFTLEYAQNWQGPYTSVQVVKNSGTNPTAQAPIASGVVPFSQPLYIRVHAQPTRKIQIISAHSKTVKNSNGDN